MIRKNSLFKGMFVTIILIFSFFFSGCSDFFKLPVDKKIILTKNSEMTRHEYLTYLKTLDNHKTNTDELYHIVENILDSSSICRTVSSSKADIIAIDKLQITTKNHFLSNKKGRSVAENTIEEPIEIYTFTVMDSIAGKDGFVIASNDMRIGNIIAIAEGSFENSDNPFVDDLYEYLIDYVESTIIEYNNISEIEIEQVLKKELVNQAEYARVVGTDPDYFNSEWSVYDTWSDFKVQKEPLLSTKWGQGRPYNGFINARINDSDYLVGCTATALAQIIAYHEGIINNAPYKAHNFTSETFWDYIGEWYGIYDWTLLKTATIYNSYFMGQIAALMWQVGSNVRTDFYKEKGNSITPIFDPDQPLYNGLKNMGYTIDGYTITNKGMFEATGIISETNSSFSLIYYKDIGYVKNAIELNRPILVYGARMDKKTAHNWVIDGYGTISTYKEYIKNKKTGQIDVLTVNINNCLVVHCNLGWNGSSDGWYIYGLFDTVHRKWVNRNTDSPVWNSSPHYSRSVKISVPVKTY
jgi:hypothetical protein